MPNITLLYHALEVNFPEMMSDLCSMTAYHGQPLNYIIENCLKAGICDYGLRLEGRHFYYKLQEGDEGYEGQEEYVEVELFPPDKETTHA